MILTLASVVIFLGFGLYCIIRRKEAAQGFGLAMGARFPPGCMVLFGLGFILIALTFFLLYLRGILT
ncbi:MAG: hypothetical protein ABIR47_16435 [Candidatus Kapaibacterium sp.]